MLPDVSISATTPDPLGSLMISRWLRVEWRAVAVTVTRHECVPRPSRWPIRVHFRR